MKSARGQVRDVPTELERRPTPGLYRFRIAERVCQHEQVVSETSHTSIGDSSRKGVSSSRDVEGRTLSLEISVGPTPFPNVFLLFLLNHSPAPPFDLLQGSFEKGERFVTEEHDLVSLSAEEEVRLRDLAQQERLEWLGQESGQEVEALDLRRSERSRGRVHGREGSRG